MTMDVSLVIGGLKGILENLCDNLIIRIVLLGKWQVHLVII